LLCIFLGVFFGRRPLLAQTAWNSVLSNDRSHSFRLDLLPSVSWGFLGIPKQLQSPWMIL
jgi:hypothetical protein